MITIPYVHVLRRHASFTDPLRLQVHLVNSFLRPVPLTWTVSVHLTRRGPGSPSPFPPYEVPLIVSHRQLGCGPSVVHLNASPLAHHVRPTGRATLTRPSHATQASAHPLYSALMCVPEVEVLGRSEIYVEGRSGEDVVASVVVEVETGFEPGPLNAARERMRLGTQKLQGAPPDAREHWDKLVRVVAVERVKVGKPNVSW